MKPLFHVLPLLLLALTAAAGVPATNPSPIPLDQLGTTVEKQYSGDGLSVCATDGGARLRCVFQKMEGEVTREGLWLMSTAEESKGERFRVMAAAVGRAAFADAGNTGSADLQSALRLKGRSRAPARWKWRAKSPGSSGPDWSRNTA